MSQLIENIKIEEGFSGVVYQDHLGFDTIGYGCKMPLTQDEAELILQYRLRRTINAVNSSLYYLDIKSDAWDILYEMAYQLGTGGLLKFKNMIAALKEQDYKQASVEGRDSLWYKQTPNRAERLMTRLENL